MASKNPPGQDVPEQDVSAQGSPEQEIIARESLLEFPCKFPIKAMGLDQDNFQALIEAIILADAKMYPGETVKTNASGGGKYISITVTIEAQSQQQLDSIYMDLTANKKVLMAL